MNKNDIYRAIIDPNGLKVGTCGILFRISGLNPGGLLQCLPMAMENDAEVFDWREDEWLFYSNELMGLQEVPVTDLPL